MELRGLVAAPLLVVVVLAGSLAASASTGKASRTGPCVVRRAGHRACWQRYQAAAAPAAPTWETVTSFRVPAFTPTRTIDVYSEPAFFAAWSNIRPGDEIDVHGVTFTGEVALAAKQLPDWAVVRFDSKTSFAGYPGTKDLPAVWLDKISHVRFYGGDISDSASSGQAGTGILIYDSTDVSWWGFNVHDVGGSGVFVAGITRTVASVDLKGEVSHWGENLSWDPHAEKGTGLHGILVADSNYGVEDSRFAIYAHDGATGAGMEIGGASSTDGAWDNTIYMSCRNLTMEATRQIAGNCIQAWGDNVTGNKIAYLRAANIQGRAWDAEGMYKRQSLATDSIAYGRASDTNLNPHLETTEPSVPARAAWDGRHGIRLGDVSSG